MQSSNLGRQRKEVLLLAHKKLLDLDSRNFQGTIKFFYDKEKGMVKFLIEEYGNFGTQNTNSREIGIKNC